MKRSISGYRILPIVNGLNKVTLDERSLRFKNFHQNPPLPPFNKGGVGGFLLRKLHMQ